MRSVNWMKSGYRICILLLVSFSSLGQTKHAAAIVDWAASTRHSNPRAAIDTLKNCIVRYGEAHQTENAAACICLLSVVQLEQLKSMQLALSTVEQLKTLAAENKQPQLLIDYYNQLGVLYYNEEVDMNRAFQYFKKALYLSKKQGTNYHVDKVLSNYGLAFLHENQPVKARYWFKKAISSCQLQTGKRGTPAYFHNVGVSYLAEGSVDSAAYYFHEALSLSKVTSDKKDDTEARMTLGIFYQETGNYPAALKELLLVYQQFKFLPNYTARILVCQGIADTYAALKDYNRAYAFRTKERNYKDAMRKVNLMEQALRYEHKTKVLQHEQDRLRWRKQGVLALIMFLSVVGVLLLVLIRLRILRKRENLASVQKVLASERLNREVQQKEQELAQKEHYILEKDTLIVQLTKQLQESLEALEIGRKQHMQTTMNELKHSKVVNRWEEFELRFNKVHPEFFKNIDEKYPNLTNNERKLSAYLVMDMTTKDISALTGQSPHSINIARGRLRKQLGLTHTNEDVHLFLRGFLERVV